MNQVDTLSEKRQAYAKTVDKEILAAVEFELEGAVGHAGGVLTGLSVKFGASDCLLTLRADFGAKKMVSFVGCPDLGSCLRKGVTEAYHDGLRWREDEFARR